MNEIKYDFEFITSALGLAQYHEGAFNPAQIIKIERGTETGFCLIYLADSPQSPIACTPENMAQLETLIRRRQADVKANQREQIKEQIRTQAQVVEELNNAPRPASGIPIIGRKPGRG